MKKLNILFEKLKANPIKAQRDITLEMSEINDIIEKMVLRIDNKIKALKIMETRADQKIAILDGMITKLKTKPFIGVTSDKAEQGHQNDVQTLADKGFNAEQIARILDLPSGEVELILNLVQ
ncbi:MAG: hypothetical protein HY879_00735 [Deltaproteobacteria bacterium]|nr:hypothetical protein [Deltaproteobacteria bacterium]